MIGKHSSPQRHLDLDGANNIRDIGGYTTSDGKTTRWKTMLRADNVAGLPPQSQAALIDYGVRTVIDLRRDDQVEKMSNVFADSMRVGYFHHNFAGDLSGDDLAASSDVARVWIERMESLEGPARKTARYCLRLDTRGHVIRKILSTLSTPGILPALYHCRGGKDRTGLVSALVLGLAGVPDVTIAEDYALSAYCLWRGSLADRGVREPYDGAPPESFDAKEYRLHQQNTPPEVMDGVFQYLRERYGGVEGYALEIGLTKGQIAAIRGAIVE